MKNQPLWKEPRQMSYKAAQRCEDALEQRCRCRCGGVLHGAKRGAIGDLPVTDPHFPARVCAVCGGTGMLVDVGITIGCRKCNAKGYTATKTTQRLIEAEQDRLTTACFTGDPAA